MRMSHVYQPLMLMELLGHGFPGNSQPGPRAGRNPPDPGVGRDPDRGLHRTRQAVGGQGSPSTASPATSEAPTTWWAGRSCATPSATSCCNCAANALTLSESNAARRYSPTGAATACRSAARSKSGHGADGLAMHQPKWNAVVDAGRRSRNQIRWAGTVRWRAARPQAPAWPASDHGWPASSARSLH